MMDKVCLVTYVYGYKYQMFVPFLVYSCHKSYPEYDIQIFLHDNLNPQISATINDFKVDNLIIHENIFNGKEVMTPLKAQCLRWVLWDDSFMTYDYIYMVDVDMFYIREPIPLHVQHISHMSTIGLCYDNLLRRHNRHPFRLRSLAGRIQRAGFKNMARFFFSDRYVYRATGLHFIEVKGYYSKFTSDIREKFRKDIMDMSFVKYDMLANDEALLYIMLQYSGLHPEKLPVGLNSVDVLDFNNPIQVEFRPHHGIHLGIFKGDRNNKYDSILNSEAYTYYVNEFKNNILTDLVFGALYNSSSDYIKKIFSDFFGYYHIRRPQ